jgi:hypothetical protein
MEKANLVKEDISDLISHTFGESTAHQFDVSYMDATLPIFTDGAKRVLESFLGAKVTKEKLTEIYQKYNLEHSYA